MTWKKRAMISLKKLSKIGSTTALLFGALSVAAQDRQIDHFKSQILYEKMYEADFNGNLISSLMYKCSGDLLDFSMVTNFPQIGYFSRKHLLGRGAANNIINIVTFGKIGNDPVWGQECEDINQTCQDPPNQAGDALATVLYQSSTTEGTVDFLCDVLFWDYVDEFGLTAEQLVQETIYELDKERDPQKTFKYKKDSLKAISKIEHLVSSRPGRTQHWRMDLNIYELQEFRIRRFQEIIDKEFIMSNNTSKNSQLNSVKDKKIASQVQGELNRLGCNAGNVDGIVGPKSKRALKNFSSQVEMNYDKDNFFSSNFLNALISLKGTVC